MEACYLSNWRIFLHSNSRPQRTNVAKEEWFNISQQFWLFPLSGVQRVFWFFCEEASNTRKKGWRANYMLLLVKHERTSDQKLQQSKAMFHMQENLVVPEKAQIILLWVLDHLKNLKQNQTLFGALCTLFWRYQKILLHYKNITSSLTLVMKAEV